MQSYDQAGYEPQVRGTGIGCALLGPIAVFGSVLLMEEHSHAGDNYLLAEIVGWSVLCIGAGLGIGGLCGRLHTKGHGRFAFVGAIASTLAVIALLVAEMQPATPMWAKDAFIAFLKILGIAVIPAFGAWVLWRHKRSDKA